MKMTNELKVGVIITAAFLVGIIFWVKTTDFNAQPYRLKAVFNYAEGVKQDSIIKLSGIEVGRVEKIKIVYEPDTKIELTLSLNKEARIHQDSLAFISTSGMIGDAYIGLTPGSADKPFLKEGDMVTSEDPIEMRKLMKKADAISENLDKTLVEVKKLAENVNGVVSDNKSRIENIAGNLEQTSVNFKEFSEDIKSHPWKLLSKK